MQNSMQAESAMEKITIAQYIQHKADKFQLYKFGLTFEFVSVSSEKLHDEL